MSTQPSRESRYGPFDARDLSRLIVHRDRLPGADSTTPLPAVSRGGATAEGIRVIGPADLLSAYPGS